LPSLAQKSLADLRRKLVGEYPSREDGPILSCEYSLCDLYPNQRKNAVPKAWRRLERRGCHGISRYRWGCSTRNVASAQAPRKGYHLYTQLTFSLLSDRSPIAEVSFARKTPVHWPRATPS